MKSVAVLGGDGFCGWPLALHLSRYGYRVTIIDNFFHRRWDEHYNTGSLVPIASMKDRISTWNKVSQELHASGRDLAIGSVDFIEMDVAEEYERLAQWLKENKPLALVHFAEQRAAPVSMKSEATQRHTIKNNTMATTNILVALVSSSPDTHLVHMGTMGVYGYGTVPDTVVPEGYLTVEIQGNPVEIIHPYYPGSAYHATKAADNMYMNFYSRNYKLAITDLHQGIIWGCQTEETQLHPNLSNRYDYDSDYGTVLNRFFVQALSGEPMTVYGSGGQTRALIHIQDSVRCVRLAIEHPPNRGDRLRIFNQLAETQSLNGMAEIVKSVVETAKRQSISNPRLESASNSLKAANAHLRSFGWTPMFLDATQLAAEVKFLAPHLHSLGQRPNNLPSSF